MKVSEYKQVGTRTEEKTVIVPAQYDDNGNLVTEEHEETASVEVPVMDWIMRDMTVEEEARHIAEHAELPEPKLTVEERIAELEQTIRILLGGDADE